eukprot:g883.t1
MNAGLLVPHNGLSLTQLRAETPGCKRVTHLNNAGCSLPCKRVLEATQTYYKTEALYGGYEAIDLHSTELQKPYVKLSKLINCAEEELAIVSSATSAWQQVLFGLDNLAPGDVVLTTPNEYGSNYINLLQLHRRKGILISVIPEDPNGDLDLEKLESLLRSSKTKLIAITHVPTNSGSVYDVHAVGKLAKQYGVPFLLDACQSAGQMEIDVKSIQCDFLSGTSRKFLRGPRGVGFLYINREQFECFEPTAMDVRGAIWNSPMKYTPLENARRCEQYEINFGAKVGFGVAVEYCMELGVDWIAHRIKQLATYLRQQLQGIPRVSVHDHCSTLCGIVSFTLHKKSSEEMVHVLRNKKINVSCSKISSTRLKMQQQGLESVVRASVHYYNSFDELDLFLNALN